MIKNKILYPLSGLSLILFFALTEVQPFSTKLENVPRRATAHLFVLLLPSSFKNTSTLILLPFAFIFAFLAAIPFKKHGFRLLPFILILCGMSFFLFATLLKDANKIGPIWSLFGFAWIGANLWANDLNYFYGTVIAEFLWDMGSGAQALYYNIRALSEPYGNNISPKVVVIVDSIGVIITVICWIKMMDPDNLRIKISNRLHINLPSLKIKNET